MYWDTPTYDSVKSIHIFFTLKWLSLAWLQVSEEHFRHCFDEVWYDHLHTIPDTATDLSDPDLDANETDRMKSLPDVPFYKFINLEKDDSIHPSQYSRFEQSWWQGDSNKWHSAGPSNPFNPTRLSRSVSRTELAGLLIFGRAG